jgi:hypothetical protein
MVRMTRTLLIATTALVGAACAEKINNTSAINSPQLTAAFSTSPVGMESTTSSFSDGANTPGQAFEPAGRNDQKEQEGPNGLALGRDFMGAGLTLDLLGGRLGGFQPFDREHDDESSTGCSFANGVTTCTSTRNGLTVTRTITWTDASGTAQSARTATTHKAVFHSDVAGTRTSRDGKVTSTVALKSDLTVVGLEATSTQRNVDGTSSGTETSSGTNKDGDTFTAVRDASDAIAGVVIPVANGKPTYPTAGTVTRTMKVTLTLNGTTTTSQRSEVITYDGSSTAKLVITKDGTTKNCTIPLPRGKPTCS